MHFQHLSGEQGRWFEDTCRNALRWVGFELMDGRQAFPDIGVEVDIVATNRHGVSFFCSCKGSLRGNRPGLKRTDTVKKAIADVVLLHEFGIGPILLMASHLPNQGAAAAMLTTAQRIVPFEIIDPLQDFNRLLQLVDADEPKLRMIFGSNTTAQRQ